MVNVFLTLKYFQIISNNIFGLVSGMDVEFLGVGRSPDSRNFSPPQLSTFYRNSKSMSILVRTFFPKIREPLRYKTSAIGWEVMILSVDQVIIKSRVWPLSLVCS